MNSFSSKDRQKIISELSSSSFDLIVIGGGITGAGIALDATVRGLKVALVEMQDFASGTSGRSTKLIHGGLRYLKQLEFKLVAEVGREREIIHRLAPHLTKPEPMLLPIVKNGSLGKLSTRFAMSVYEWLAGVKKEEKYKFLSAEEASQKEPCFKKEGLLAGILFYEYRTDDARLTIEVMKEAVHRGVTALNYLKVLEFLYEADGKMTGVKVMDQLRENSFEIRSKCVVNAGGPWVDKLDKLDKQKADYLILTKGVHLVVDHTKLPVKQAMYFDAFDKRMIFVIPREGKTYIGTTDTFYKGEPEYPQTTDGDINYLLRCVNENFPGCKISLSDIESSWAGLRPLIKKKGKKPSEISRKDEMFVSPSGLITIAGGKLTGYRKMAERVVNKVVKNLHRDDMCSECSTDSVILSGGDIKSSMKDFISFASDRGRDLDLAPGEIEKLAMRYGSNIDKIFSIISNLKDEKSYLPLSLRAQIVYGIEHEMCYTPCDFFIRRSSLMYFNRSMVMKYKDKVFSYMKNLLGWNEDLSSRFRTELENNLNSL